MRKCGSTDLRGPAYSKQNKWKEIQGACYGLICPPPQSSCIDVLAPAPQSMALLGHEISQDDVMLKQGEP